MKLAQAVRLGVVVVSTLTCANFALAGKALDDKMKTVKADTQAKLDAVKTACGCALTLSTSGYKEPTDANRVSYAADSVAAAAKKYCSEDKYKKAFCGKIKSLDIKYAKDIPPATLRGTALQLGSNNTGYTGEKGISTILDTLAD